MTLRTTLWALAFASVPIPAIAQQSIIATIESFQLADPQQCPQVVGIAADLPQGGNWLIGEQIELLGRTALSGSRDRGDVIFDLNQPFEKVTCYQQFPELSTGEPADLYFVATQDRQTCGWVDANDLLATNTRGQGRGSRSICETPRALFFSDLCTKLRGFGTRYAEEVCVDPPFGLRAKGVLVGATVDGFADTSLRYPFYNRPERNPAYERGGSSFFSTIEIHDVSRSSDGSVMFLVGDGVGDMFGWIEVDGVRLWPTRMGVFFDPEGRGGFYSKDTDMLSDWRRSLFDPNVTLDLNRIEQHLHGDKPLVSYPIVRFVDTSERLEFLNEDTDFHEVILLGTAGEGRASALLSAAESAAQLEVLREINIHILVDTTESMVDYLSTLRVGISEFIAGYDAARRDPATQLPDARIAVTAYSDFIDTDGKISMVELVPPVAVSGSTDTRLFLSELERHSGLADPIGGFVEAGLEAADQISGQFKGNGWFEARPNFIIHIADHGSRSDAEGAIPEITARMARNNAFYVPVNAATDDKGETRRESARAAYLRQGSAMVNAQGILSSELSESVFRVDLDTGDAAATVTQILRFVVQEVSAALQKNRSDESGLELSTTTGDSALDAASANFRIDEVLLERLGIASGSQQVRVALVEPSFSPTARRDGGPETEVAWTYTVALEEVQVSELQPSLERLCTLLGSGGQPDQFRALIRNMAASFSGDALTTNDEVLAVLSELSTLPGVQGSFLARPVQSILDDASSDDAGVVNELREDVCWTAYHFNNVIGKRYAEPQELQWNGARFVLRPGVSIRKRNYFYEPSVGAPAYYIPSWFFVVPSEVRALKAELERSDEGGTTGPCTGFFCE